MPTGTGFHMTDKRKATAIAHLKSQGTVGSLAVKFGITRKTLDKHLKAHKIDVKGLQLSGMDKLRQKAYLLIDDMDTSKEAFEASMKFLTRYEKLEDNSADTIDDTEAKAIEVRLQILKELS